MDYIVKIFIFGFYFSAIAFMLDSIMKLVSNYIANIPLSGWLCQFGILTGLSLYFSIVVSAYLMKKSIDFWK